MSNIIKMDSKVRTRDGEDKFLRILAVDMDPAKYGGATVLAEYRQGLSFLLPDGRKRPDRDSPDDLILIRPLHETLKVDDKVMVRDDDDQVWLPRHFAGYEEGVEHPWLCWMSQGTSWSACGEVVAWKQLRLPTPEELEGSAAIAKAEGGAR